VTGPHQCQRPPDLADLPADTHLMRLSDVGTFTLEKVTYMVNRQRARQQVLVVTDTDKIIVTDLQAEILAEHTRPAPGIKYAGNGRPRGPRPKTEETSPKS